LSFCGQIWLNPLVVDRHFLIKKIKIKKKKKNICPHFQKNCKEKKKKKENLFHNIAIIFNN
jgi:hypothetical protein